MLPFLLSGRENSTHRKHDLRAVLNDVRSMHGRASSSASRRTILLSGLRLICRYSAECGPVASSIWWMIRVLRSASLLVATALRYRFASTVARCGPRPKAARGQATMEPSGEKAPRFISQSTHPAISVHSGSLQPKKATVPRCRLSLKTCKLLPQALSTWLTSTRATPGPTQPRTPTIMVSLSKSLDIPSHNENLSCSRAVVWSYEALHGLPASEDSPETTNVSTQPSKAYACLPSPHSC